MNPLVQRVGWMLIHSVWEDILIWGVLQIALLVLARKAPQVRYFAACVALVAMAVLPWLTFDASDLSARLKESHSVSSEAVVGTLQSSESHQTFSGEISRNQTGWTPVPLDLPHDASIHLSRLLPFLVAAWIVGLIFSSVRLSIRWRKVQALIQQPFRLPNPAWKERFDQLVRLSGVDRIVRLGETAAVSVPVVAGWMKPVILLPLGVVTSMPAEQIEAILLHELAHISRHDYLVNLLQNMIETIFFYHPAVWAMSRRIRLERELACDDQTVQWCKNPRTYAEALAGFEEFRHQSPLLAATGEGDLFTRIRRILVGRESERRGAPIFAVAGFCGIGIYLASMFLMPVLAEHIMTAQERVATIQALQIPPPLPDFSADFKESVWVTGTIRTDDGRSLPASLKDSSPNSASRSSLISSYPKGSVTETLYIEPGHRTFTGNARNGRIDLSIWAEGYAPLQLSGLRGKDGKLNLDLELKRGFPGQVRITGPNGQPLQDVVVTATALISGHQIDLTLPPVRTDARGMASFGNVEANSEIHLTASKPGWQMIDWIVSQWPNQEPAVWVMQPAIQTSGVAIDQVTRQPIPDAEIILAERRGGDPLHSMNYGPDSARILARSDKKGHFELKTLNNDYSYRIYVQAPGYQTASFSIQTGDRNVVFEIPPGLHVNGKILDPDGKLKELRYQVVLRCDYNLDASPHFAFGQSKFQTLSKLGPEIPFFFRDLPKGQVEFFLDHTWYKLDLQSNRDDFIIDLGLKNTTMTDKPSLRPIEIVLKTAAGQVSPTGTIDVQYWYNGIIGANTYDNKTVPIKNGIARVDLPAPTSVNLRADGINGYWFAPEAFEVPTGTGSFSHVVDAFPAGVIYGVATVASNLKSRPFYVSPIVIKKPPGVENLNLGPGGQIPHSLSNQYVTSPLPFGGTYAVLLYSSPSYFVSSHAVVDAEHPLIVRNMNLVAKDSLTGQFVDENNQPIAFQEVDLIYHPAEEGEFMSDAAITRRDGSFSIPNMNFSVPGSYELQLYSDAWEKTKIRIDGHTPQPIIIPLRHRAK